MNLENTLTPPEPEAVISNKTGLPLPNILCKKHNTWKTRSGKKQSSACGKCKWESQLEKGHNLKKIAKKKQGRPTPKTHPELFIHENGKIYYSKQTGNPMPIVYCGKHNCQKYRYDNFKQTPYCPLCAGTTTDQTRKNNKLKGITLLGGKCSSCKQEFEPYQYHFHHLDPSTKKYTITKILSRSWEDPELQAEFKKCILLCGNCHAEEHDIQDKQKSPYVTKNYRERKIGLVKSHGNKCVLCNYDKYWGALEFHHVNPKDKSFSLGNTAGLFRNWDDIWKEGLKCVMVCNNCHKSIEYGKCEQVDLFSLRPELVDKYTGYREKIKLNQSKASTTKLKCPSCGEPKWAKSKLCRSCSSKKSYGANWPSDDDLLKMAQKYPDTYIAKKVGVSNVAVRKRINRISEKSRDKTQGMTS